MKSIILTITMLMLTACAGTQTPMQTASDLLGRISDNKLSTALAADCQNTLDKVIPEWEGKIPEDQIFQAKACPTMILYALEGDKQDLAAIQQIALSVDAVFAGIGDGAFRPDLIERMTRAKFAPQNEIGSDMAPRVAAFKDRFIKRWSAVRKMCALVVDDEKLINLGMRMFGGGLQ
jgi:hypothetical protein